MPQKFASSNSRLAERLGASSNLIIDWFRQPALDIAESILRLRRLRGISQGELARRMKTQQPAVARLESGRSNVGVETLVSAATALDATIRVLIEPKELLACEALHHSWWERPACMDVNQPLTTERMSFAFTKQVFVTCFIDNRTVNYGEPSTVIQQENIGNAEILNGIFARTAQRSLPPTTVVENG